MKRYFIIISVLLLLCLAITGCKKDESSAEKKGDDVVSYYDVEF